MFVTMTRTICQVNIFVEIDYTAFKNLLIAVTAK